MSVVKFYKALCAIALAFAVGGVAVVAMPISAGADSYKAGTISSSVKTYKITYVLGGAANNTSNPSTYKSNAAVSLKKPTRTGYTFKGWFADSKFTKRVTSIPKGSRGNKTFYAKWQASTYSISYVMNGGKNNTANPSSYQYNARLIKLWTPTRTGYVFGGWYEDKALSKKVDSIPKGAIGNKTVYAKWTPATYKISYVLGAGTNNAANPPRYSYNQATLYLKAPSRNGYTFCGWFSDAQHTVASSSVPKGSIGYRTFYAKWKARTYAVTYVLDPLGGTSLSACDISNSNSTSYVCGKGLTSLATPSRLGYVFQGWYEDKALSKKVTSIEKSAFGNKTLYAKWKMYAPASTGLTGRAKINEHVNTFAQRYANCAKGGIALVGSSSFARWTAFDEFGAQGLASNKLYNCAVSGARISDLAENPAYIKMVASLEPSVVLIYGANDLSVELADTTKNAEKVNALIEEFDRLVCGIAAECPNHVEFIVMGPTNTPNGYQSSKNVGGVTAKSCTSWDRGDMYDALLREYAGQYDNVTYFNVSRYVGFRDEAGYMRFYTNGEKLMDASQTSSAEELLSGEKTSPYFGSDKAHLTKLTYSTAWGELVGMAIGMAG